MLRNKFSERNVRLCTYLKLRNINEWKDTPCSLFRRLNIVKMTVLHKTVYTLNAIPKKIPIGYFFFSNYKNSF